jgi:hypothetical protein
MTNLIDWMLVQQNNITTALILVGYVFMALRAIVKATTTARDDAWLEYFDEHVASVKTIAANAYEVVENMVAKGLLPKDNKYVKFLELVSNSYETVKQQPMPKILMVVADSVATGKAIADKASLGIEQLKSEIKGEIGPNTPATREEILPGPIAYQKNNPVTLDNPK